MDDDHEHYIRCETLDELNELCGWLDVYSVANRHRNGEEGWKAHYEDLLKSVELFGILNISVYYNEYMNRSDGLEEFMLGFWINLKEAEYNEGSIYFDTAKHINIIDGYLWVDYNSLYD
jgi:hypothetical protein